MALPKINWWKALPIGSNIRETIEDVRGILDSLRKKDEKRSDDTGNSGKVVKGGS